MITFLVLVVLGLVIICVIFGKPKGGGIKRMPTQEEIANRPPAPPPQGK